MKTCLMCHTTMPDDLSIGLCQICIGLVASSITPLESHTEPTMEIEYKVIGLMINSTMDEEREFLARYGAQGWQLVAVRGVADILLYYFSRPKNKETKVPTRGVLTV